MSAYQKSSHLASPHEAARPTHGRSDPVLRRTTAEKDGARAAAAPSVDGLVLGVARAAARLELGRGPTAVDAHARVGQDVAGNVLPWVESHSALAARRSIDVVSSFPRVLVCGSDRVHVHSHGPYCIKNAKQSTHMCSSLTRRQTMQVSDQPPKFALKYSRRLSSARGIARPCQ